MPVSWRRCGGGDDEHGDLRQHNEELRFPPRRSPPLPFLPEPTNGEDLVQKERAPPKDPTPINLPTKTYTPVSTARALKSSTWQSLYSLLSSIRQPAHITPELVELLHIHLVPNTPFQDLLPDCSQPCDAVKALDGPDRGDHADRLNTMVRELSYPTDQAFKSLLRLVDGPEKVHLAYARRFYSGLEHMSHYWDTSLDEFYEVPDDEPAASSTVHAGTDARPSATSDGKYVQSEFMSASNHCQANIQVSHSDKEDDMEVDNDDNINNDEKVATPPKMKCVYKGRRTGTGRDMQEDYRDEMLKGFMEAAAWAWGCQVVKPMVHPRLAMGTMLVPMKQNFIVGRSPKERTAARRGILEGPVLGMLGRGVMGHWNDGPWPELEAEKAEAYDLLREVGAMLELAQERARDGAKETRPGTEKWWTTRPRWGGGPGGPMGYEDELQKEWYLDEGKVKECEKAKKRPLSETAVHRTVAEPADEDGPKEEKVTVPVSVRKKSGRDAKRGLPAKPGGNWKRWNAMGDRWKLVQPGSSLWDNQRIYRRIGKEERPAGRQSADTFDNIFLVSSMNHHISILRMRVSDRYLAWLQSGSESGAPDESVPSHGPAGVLQLWRTKWYDLFKPEERVEAQKGLFHVVGWLVRDDGDQGRGQTLPLE